MSVGEGLEFESTIESDTRNLNHIVKDLLDDYGSEIHLLRDPTRGGVATVLTEIARDCQLGIDIHQRNIPINEQVYAACEILGLDPLYVANEGVFIAIVSAECANDVLAQMHDNENTKNAKIIRDIVSDHPRQVVMTSNIGGKRVVNMLVGEQLPRIC